MKTRIYIIGNIPALINKFCEDKFYKTQIQLLQMGYDVINPIIRLTSNGYSFEDAKRNNLQDLMFSDAVYIMPCVEFVKGKNNLEIKLALDFNLTIITGVLDLSSTEKRPNHSKKRVKLINK